MRGLLLYGDTERSATLRHEIPIPIGDPFLFAQAGGRTYILISRLETGRLARALPEAQLFDYFELGYKELVEGGLSRAEAGREIEARVVQEIGIEEAIVPAEFPLALADRLRDAGVTLIVDEPAIELRRRVKTTVELDGIRAAQRAAEAGMAAASDVLARSRAGADGRLELDGKPLLAEDVRAALRAACAENGAPCPPDVIVASIWQGNGHEPGSGPLPSGLPIHVDLWPRHEETACWADMARTFVVGEPSPEHADRLAEMEMLSLRALTEAKEAVRPGVTGRELFDATCELFESAGYPTQRTSGPKEDEGFQWALGHGVGLEVHESPSLGLAGRDPFVVGDVVALEPGLSQEGIGAVVFEDLVVVTEDGCQVLTDFPYDLLPARA
ncbi:MAG TPA: M24 family metallopeptidase [Gaiellaceae bacterium]|nr:M24 family metallopeptidase [Gaiellaceae bacterium]